MKRVAVFIDGSNFYYGLKSINEKYTDFKIDFKLLCNKLVTPERKLVKIYYYNAPLKQEKNPSLYKEQQRMFDRLRDVPLCEVILCKRQKKNR